MRILVTNDDGINAPGLAVARDIAAALSDDVWVVAPETDQSGSSHSLTLSEPLRMRVLDERVFAVRGTPTDCVIMGVRHILRERKPDLVLSGVNRGQNLAEHVTYSGTVAGAMEGTVLGVRSIALSQTIDFANGGPARWDCARTLAPPLIKALYDVAWGPGVLLNVNFPDTEPDGVEGTVVTRQGRRDQSLLHIDERRDTYQRPYYWIGFDNVASNPAADTDLRAVYDGKISVTPLHADLTQREAFATIEGAVAQMRPR
ncbi:MAG: 5'/3'-nucleotidase SurE [Pseudomonadota bacterium]